MTLKSLLSLTKTLSVTTAMLCASHAVSAGDFDHTTMTIGDQIWTSNLVMGVTPMPCAKEPGTANRGYCGAIINNCYAGETTTCDVGRLFSLHSARLACEYVASYNGGGWRLPTEADWQKLVNAAGGAYPQSSGEQAYSVLAGGNSTFKPAFGGKTIYFLNTDSDSNNPTFTAGYYDFSTIGYYWADDPAMADTDEGRVYTFRSTDNRVLRENYPAHDEYSVRCVKDAA